MSTRLTEAESVLEEHMGYLLVSEMERRGVSRTAISRFVHEAKLEKAAKGLYVSPNAESDPLFELQYRYPKAIFSHETALFLLGEGERIPLTPTITLPQSAGTARLKNEDVTVRKVSDNRFLIGLSSAITMFGHTVRVYDLERTICDLFRSRSTVDPQDLQSAFQNYMRSAHTDLAKLMNYAREFRLVNVMRPYLEAVMPA
ncbi:type IV toxin-antitoxin system AbiEi family antitoxin domain-containing protein [Bifidobacterium sp. UTBIF-78]|uniref:type IV toxin-antitoxin system AbiEi family antitoxin domain-containing protein n=1 Tax=Bifidobacterium sp. UTBIF-78 TaxID=1465263 RepID=UPI001125F317|nr:type IV toxin-antitoxin system AbiEi family antitoxin domain-containing protein [Bifidobacterium sp. UTBIF-78]TPF93770.1 hypothetical protein BG22_06640 [Bifidobacterium sp. UTBIF-78]